MEEAMKRIRVNLSTDYDILLGTNILSALGKELKKVIFGKKVMIITDTNVFKLYGNEVQRGLEKEGFSVDKLVFDAGESVKWIDNLTTAWDYLADKDYSRLDGIVALGGGTIGDLAGFCAATYMRGIRFIQCPTTLLAVIDSSIGGKTAINLSAGKNLVGSFYQPNLVFSDLRLLQTLPPRELLSGKGELLKYAILKGGRLFELVEDGIEKNLNEILELCILCKKEIVEEDERESGKRKLLNLGHTLGHAIEKLTNFSITHGEAVLMGMEYMVRLAYKREELSAEEYKRIIKVFVREGVDGTYIDVKLLLPYLRKDKKSEGENISLVTVTGLGNCRITSVEYDSLGGYLKC